VSEPGPGPLLGSGRNADVYDVGGGRVLRPDWEGAARGPGVADVAMTWVIVAFSEVPGPRLQAAPGRAGQAAFGRAFLRAAGLADRSWLEIAVRQRLTDENLLASEKTRLERLLRSGKIRGG
jgi:hypothetical protein